MKRLFLYFSLTGNGDFIANYLEDKDFDIRKVVEKKKAPKAFFFRKPNGNPRLFNCRDESELN